MTNPGRWTCKFTTVQHAGAMRVIGGATPWLEW